MIPSEYVYQFGGYTLGMAIYNNFCPLLNHFREQKAIDAMGVVFFYIKDRYNALFWLNTLLD